MISMQPTFDAEDDLRVPRCSESCEQHDGKRCRLLGQRPATICEPAVEEMALVIGKAGMKRLRGTWS